MKFRRAGKPHYKPFPLTVCLVSHFYGIGRGVTNAIKMRMQHSHQGKLPRMRRPYCGGMSWFGDFSSLVFLSCLVFARINYYFANRESQTPKLNTCAYRKKICYLERNSRYFEAGKSLFAVDVYNNVLF